MAKTTNRVLSFAKSAKRASSYNPECYSGLYEEGEVEKTRKPMQCEAEPSEIL